ncbi:MAG: hypothetical protein H5U07_07650 [Candidatus Aminicenantes bacterium]|nr:hypothetical protein [Candidatus Aminicenantes bacterium]
MGKRRLWFWIFFGLAIILVVIGLTSGEFKTVWLKAKTVCLECIGIG